MFEKNGAEILCECLRREGVQVVFGIPGVHNVFLFEALRRAKIRVVTATHEQSLALMANGYYRATGKPGVFVIVAGPGLTNAFTGIAESRLDSCAVIGIVTGKRTDLDQEFQLHEIHQVELATPIVKQVFKITQAEKIFERMQHAFQLAQSGEPGPVILEVATNAYWERAEFAATKPARIELAQASHDAFARVIAQIQQAKHIGLFVGQGALDAADQIAQLAEWLSAPVATTVSGRGCLREDHSLAMDFRWGRNGVELTNQVLAHCDLVIAVGAKFSENGTAGYALKFPGALIQVDASADVLGKNYPAGLTAQMDARDFFAGLIERKALFGPRQDPEIRNIVRVAKAKHTADHADAGIRFALGEHTCTPREFFRALRELLPEDAILVADSGFNQFLAIENFQVFEPRTLITPADYQAMGYAIPSALGAAIACPNKKIVAVVGDGGFVMSGLELLTAQREKIGLLTIVLNDGYFGFIKEVQEELFGATTGIKLANPDFKKLAESLHIPHHTVAGDIKNTLRECIQSNEPRLLQVTVAYPQKELIPMLRKRWTANLKQWAKEGRVGIERARVAVQSKLNRANE